LQLTEKTPALPISLSMRLLLNENQQRNTALDDIKALLNDHGYESSTRREEVMHLLLQYMQQNEAYRRNIREFFFGYPDEQFLQTLKAKGLVLSDFSRKKTPSPDFLSMLLDHCQILQSINNRMINNLQSLFLYPPEGMPVKDSELSKAYVLIKNTVEQIKEKGSQLSEKNKLIFDQLCRITALILWIDWIQDLKNTPDVAPVDSGGPQNNVRADLGRVSEHIKKDWLDLMSHNGCTGSQLKQWFSVIKSGCILPKTLVQKWLEELLELQKVLENGFSVPKFYYSVSDRLPNLIEKLSQQLTVLLDTGSEPQKALAPGAVANSTQPLMQKESPNQSTLNIETNKENLKV
jgi:hypothetical protein